MPLYRNLGGDSGVHSYEIRMDRIIVTFSTKVSYEYSYLKPGKQHVENMKSLAQQGHGLNSYINKYVRKRYSRKL